MSASCAAISSAIEKMAPLEMAEEWDNVGLLVGDPKQKITKALLALDVTAAVVEEASDMGAGMIIAHHPFPFHAMKTIRGDTTDGALLAQLLKKDICVYAAHTNLDAATGGVNDALAQILELRDVLPLRPNKQAIVKIATYVPSSHVETVWQAMSGAGAGNIGKYSQCGFRVAGKGTFLPGEGARPYIGAPNQLSTIDEVRIETVALAALSTGIIKAMIKAHPYEEVAYDVYSLQNAWIHGGLGRVGTLLEPETLLDFSVRVKKALGVQGVRFVGPSDAVVHSIAVCGGAGMDVVENARRCGAQVLLTGDIRYHDAQDALARGLYLVDGGHFATEVPVLKPLREYLRACSSAKGWDCLFDIAAKQADIWQWS